MKFLFGLTFAALVVICLGRFQNPDAGEGAIFFPDDNWIDNRAGIIDTDVLPEFFAEKITKFALRLDKAISAEQGAEENVLFSPLNIVTTLLMVLMGSSGRTFNQLAEALDLENGFPIGSRSEIFHRLFAHQVLDQVSPNTTLALGIYFQKGAHIRQQYLRANQNSYKALLKELDFVREPEQSRKIINDWIKEKTNGMIPTLLDGSIEPHTNMILATSAYFEDEWMTPFETAPRLRFSLTPTTTVFVDTLVSDERYNYTHNKDLDVKMVELPYKGQTKMYALLPNEKDSFNLPNLKSKLTPDVIDDMIAKQKELFCTVSMPKLNLSSSYKLKEVLKALGIESMFKSADLSIINGVPKENTRIDNGLTIDEVRQQSLLIPGDLKVNDLVHKVEMEISEIGTKAAAASELGFSWKIGSSVSLTFTRPFIFFIRDENTKAITFWGSISKPTPTFDRQLDLLG